MNLMKRETGKEFSPKALCTWKQQAFPLKKMTFPEQTLLFSKRYLSNRRDAGHPEAMLLSVVIRGYTTLKKTITVKVYTEHFLMKVCPAKAIWWSV